MTRRRAGAPLALVACVAALAVAPGASAANGACSASGDVCSAATGAGQSTRLRLTLAAHYFTQYTLCVRAPGGSTTCRTFSVHPADGGTYASSVRWASHFPDGGRGRYTATWRSGGSVVAPIVRFRVGPSVHVTPMTTAAGGVVRVGGLAGGCTSGSRVTLISRAFSHAHDFAGLPAVFATVRPDDTYRVLTRIPASRSPGVYSVTARCGGGNFGVVAHLRVA